MFRRLFLFSLFLLVAFAALSQDLPPKSNTLVTDYTNTLPSQEKDMLEHKLVAFADSTSTQIAVVLIRSVGSYDINDYTQRLGRAWGIGEKGKNNGILILVATADHKVSIQTGTGAEGAVTDITTHEIIQNDIIPRFKQGDFYAGLDAGTDKLIQYMKGEYKASKKAKDTDDNDGGGAIGFVIIIVVVVLIIVFRGRGGGGGHIIGSRGGASPFWWFLGGAMLGRGSGGWGGFSNGDGGFGGSSGGSDSGGFGGFGGGDFGGGGSSGSW